MAFEKYGALLCFICFLAFTVSPVAMRFLVTGANGFVGQSLRAELIRRGDLVRAAVRSGNVERDTFDRSVVGSIDGKTDWSTALSDQDFVIHLAARVHVMKDTAANPLVAFRQVNVHGTLNLARQAAAAGVKRFVFMSSVKVNGEYTLPGLPYTESDVPAPRDAYGVSKHEAEQGLRQLAADTGMEVVIIRPPLVYGPGVKANFASLMRAVQRGWPLPLGAVRNQRSLVALSNLVNFIVTCAAHPQAANQTFFVSDGHDLSTAELVRGLARAAGVSACLIPVPVWVLQAGATLMGRGESVQRLVGNLQVDISKANTLLGWMPPITVEEGLHRALAEMKKP